MTSDTSTPDPRPQTPDLGAADAWLTPGRFALVLGALLAVTFWRVLFGGEAFFYRDYGFLGYPFAHFHRECFWSGDFFPLWNPYVNCGAPFLAQWNTLCLYPGALIYLLLPLPWSLGFFCVAHLFLGGMGMRALAERWTGSRFGAAVAGVAFVFSGLVLGCVIYPNYLVALGWMPWVMLAVRRSWQEGGRSIVLAALAGAMQMLTGAPEIILLTWALLTALAVMDAAVKRKTENVSRGFLTNYALRITSTIALITGLCAAQLLPFFQLLSLSQRSGDAVNTFWSLPGWGWVNLFFPLFMNFQTEQGVFVMIGQAFFPSVYLGIVPLTLALLAVWRVRTPEVKLLGAATLLAVLLAMGDNFVLWGWLREVLPLGVVRFPVKALLLAAFTVPLLAAWGIRWLEARATELPDDLRNADCYNMALWERLRTHAGWREATQLMGVLVVGGLAAAVVSVSYPIGEQISRVPWPRISFFPLLPLVAGMCLIARVAFNVSPKWTEPNALFTLMLLSFCAGFSHLHILNPTIPTSAFEPGLAAAYHASKGALTPAPKLGESRIMLSPLAERALHTRMVPKFYDDFIGQRLAFWGNLNLLDGLPKVNGASTLVTREWNDVEYFLYGTTNPAPANLMDFLGVTHTTRPGELMQWERRATAMPLVSAGQQVVHGDDATKVHLPNLRRGEWNPREAVFITDDAAEKLSARVEATARVRHFQPRAGDLQSPSVSNESHGRRLQVAGTDAGDIVIEAEAAAPTVVVIAQNFYPSWHATVNGQPAPVLRANHAFQAIPIPAGKSTVRLDYVDWPFRIGAGISALTLLGCVVLWRRGSS